MKWHLNIDKGQYEILDDLEFQNLITSNDAQSAANLALELVEQHQRSRFEKILYGLLGLKIEDNVPKGRLEISLNKEKALITQLSGFIAKLFFDKPTHCNAVFKIASKKADAVFSQKLPMLFNWSAARVNIR